MNDKEFHDMRYINWRKENEFGIITQKEWNEKIDAFQKNKAKEIIFGERKNTVRAEWIKSDLTYCVNNMERITMMCVLETENAGKYNQKSKLYKYMTYKNEEKNERVEKTENGSADLTTPGADGINAVSKFFEEETGLTLRRAFGYIKEKKDYEIIRHCAVAAPPLIYVDPFFVGRIGKHAYKADISSAYPAHLRGSLPDWHTVEVIPGRQEPNEEYPFVYWNDGHHAEFGVYDTREFVKNKWFLATNDRKKNKLDNFRKVDMIVSYCCKESKYTLDGAMMDLYQKKESSKGNEKEYWKTLLVSFIGITFMKTDNPKYPLPHLAATCHGRQIKEMLDIAKSIEDEGNTLISFATDSIIWCGRPSKTTTKKENKVLGSFVSEFEDADFAFGGTGLYALAQNGQIGIIKHQGKAGAKYKQVKSLDEFLKVCNEEKLSERMLYNPKTKKYEKQWRMS